MKKKTKELINAVIDTPNLPSHLYEAAWAAFHEESKPRGRKPLEPEKLWELIDYLEERIAGGLSLHAAAEAAAGAKIVKPMRNGRYAENLTMPDGPEGEKWIDLVEDDMFTLTARQIENLYNQTPKFKPV